MLGIYSFPYQQKHILCGNAQAERIISLKNIVRIVMKAWACHTKFQTASHRKPNRSPADRFKSTGNGGTLARVLLPEIQAFFESEEGRREFAEWKVQQEQDKSKQD